ncbi:BRO family protein [Clostridium botulinum]|nr:BRO family protein [Clostridium botulinum]
MNNNLQVFTNEQFGQVRMTQINGKSYAVANDVLKSLGYSEGSWRTTLSRKCKGVTKCNGLKVNGIEVNLIPEGDIYRLITGSHLPQAEKFEIWVFDEVLPTIRKTGGYVANADLMINTYFGTLDDTHKTIVKGLFENIENQQKQIIQLKDDNETLDKENDLLSGENLKWADRNLINALVRAYGSKLGNFGEAWTKFKKEILYKHSININARITNFMNSTGKKTKPRTLKMLHDEELSNAVSTIVALCRDNDVDISDIIKKYENELNRKELVD